MNIAFLGLGNMGNPMAQNLMKAGHNLTVFDVVAAATSTMRERGASVAATAAAAVLGKDVVVSMLPASVHVESLYLSADDAGKSLLDHIPKSALVIDCSTIAPASARKVGAAAKAKGIEMIDAPVSGGVGGATNGTLTFMVGGAANALQRAESVLKGMGTNVFHAGESGAGQVAKICNNMLLAIQMTGTAEALALGVANGLDPKVLSEIMRRSSGGNWSLEVYNPFPGVMDSAPAARGYQGGFLVDLMIKDLGLAMEAAEQVGATTPMGGLARNLYMMLRQRFAAARLDFSSIQKLFSGN